MVKSSIGSENLMDGFDAMHRKPWCAPRFRYFGMIGDSIFVYPTTGSYVQHAIQWDAGIRLTCDELGVVLTGRICRPQKLMPFGIECA